ncbi:MAG: aminotransferase class V-fold PLP-dependent enzyme [Hyphomicrobium sp.]|nr:aminotransferase class V-fold PLP-dependent enzyme [Hyphomicrobium sp.]
MELTTKGRYAVTAMADIAGQSDALTVPLSQIAERQALPLAYLEQIFVGLRRAGLVESARGRSGGYRLARPAAEISIADVMAAAEEDTHFTRCANGEASCLRDAPCLTHGLWQRLGAVTSAFFASVSLADVVGGTLAGMARAQAAPSAGLRRVYLDHNATAPLRGEAKAAMIAALDVDGNPSSVHSEGRRARGVIEAAREQVARLVNAKPSEVVFTSGATESNAWVMAQPWDTIFVSGVEHDSILAPARANGAEVIMVPVARDGRVLAEQIAARVLSGAPVGRALIALQLANNETGVIQDVAAVTAFAREHGLRVHTDAVQAPGRIAIDFAGLDADTMSLSAHKLGGPKGIGALIIRDHYDLAPLIRGGGQERRRRAGTENLAGIAGFGAAAKVALAALADAPRIAGLRDQLERDVCDAVPATVVIAGSAPRLCNTATLTLPGKLAETLVIRLDLAGFAVSAGSACSSGKVGVSHVAEAMGLERDVAAGMIRVSLGPDTTQDDIAAFAAAWKQISGNAALAA